MSVKKFDLIVWDWDGTLADSTGMIANALIKGAEDAGLPTLPLAQARSVIGLGLNEAIYSLFGEMSSEQAQALATHYRRHYYAGESDILLYEGAYDTIVTLNKRGYKLAVATGKGRRGLNFALAHTKLGNFFHDTRTVDECFSKPHPQMLDGLMDVLVAMPERTIMIGDTTYDMEMARNAGVKCAAVSYGAHPKSRLDEMKPDYSFDDFSSLKGWLLDD